MADIRHVLGADADELLRVLREVRGELEDTSDATGDADDSAKAFRKTTALLGGALAATTAIVIKGTAEAIALGDAYGKMSERTGQSVERLSSLKLAAENSDTSLGALSRGITTLSRGMLDFAQTGTGPVGESLQRLGIAVTDANGDLRDADAVLNDVADALAGMENGTEKAAIAAELFGGGVGRDLIPLLNQGSEGIDRLAQKSRALGVVWSDEASQAAEDFGDSLNVLNTAGKGVFETAAQFWLPTLRDIAAAFENATLKALGFQGSTEALSEIETLNRQLAEAEDARREATDRRQQAQIRAASAWTESAREQAEAEVAEARAAEAKYEKRIAGIKRVIAGYKEEKEEVEKTGEKTEEAGEKTEQASEKKERAATAADKHAEALDREAEALARVEKAQDRRMSIADVLATVTQRATESQLSDSERLIAQYEREVARVSELVHEAVAMEEISSQQRHDIIAAGNAARAALAEQLRADLAAIDQRRVEEHRRAKEQEVADAERAAQERADVERSVAGTMLDIASQLTAGLTDALQDLNAARTQDARKRKEREIGLAILMGELQAGLAFGSTLAQMGGNPAGYAAAAAAAAAVGIATKVSAAASAADSADYFHDGGVVDERPAMLRAGEGVLTPQAVRNIGGPVAIEELNRGERPAPSMGPASITVVQKLDHRVLDVQVHRAVQRMGSPLASALRRTNPRGTARRNPYLTGAS